MTREELKEHCERQVEGCEMWAKARGEKPSGKVYEEHKLILELLEQESCNKTQMIDKSNFSQEQYLADIQSAYDCGKSVIDKIRVEIEQKARPNEIGGCGNGKSIRYGLCMALEIIDKYKESEE